MPQYRRRQGDRVSYSPQQTQRYFSQLRRYAQGLQIHPSRQESVGHSSQIYYFRSDRAPAGEWRVIYNPDGEESSGEGSGGGGSGAIGLSATCPVGCLSDLQYISVTSTRSSGSWFYSAYSVDGPGWWYVPGSSYSSTTYWRMPGSPFIPPDPYFELEDFGVQPNEHCAWSVRHVPVLEESLRYGRWNFRLEGIETFVSAYAEDIFKQLFYTAELTSPPFPIVTPSDEIGGEIYESRALGSMDYFVGSVGPLTRIPCGYSLGGSGGGGGGGGGNPGNDEAWRCNCPDQTQKQGTLSRSPWLSEQQSRSWRGSNTHTEASGPCKHIYAAAVAAGQPFARPAGGNYWDYERAPQLPNLDYTPGPDDWSEQDYLDWRDRARQRRANLDRFQRAAQQGQRQAERQNLQAEFERLGIADRSVPRNRYLQRQLRELSREAQVNPQAQDRLDNFYLDLEFGE